MNSDKLPLTNKTPLANGKRGITSTATLKGRTVLVKEHNPQSAVNTIENEAVFLQLLNSSGIGPRFIAYQEGALIREYVDGIRIGEYLATCTQNQASTIVLEIFDQCKRMDELGMNKLEMTNPYKHVLITKEHQAVMIDFERCTRTKTPKNVTQFCQYTNKTLIKTLLYTKGLFYSSEELITLGHQYKELLRTNNDTTEVFNQIKTLFTPRTITFSERVYQSLMNVPKGRVTTYKRVAQSIATKNYRAVGQALKRNPYAPLVPCHRVVNSDASVGGYKGAREGKAISEKKKLLEEEGILIKKDKVQDFVEKLFTPSSSSS